MLVKIIFLLGLFHLFLDPVLDAPLDLEHLDLPLHDVEDFLQPPDRMDNFQQRLFLFDFYGQMGSQIICQAPGVGHGADRLKDFLGNFLI